MRWESLIPVAGGRHCEACRKTVIDVEELTSAQVDALLESGERACVRVATLPDGSVLTRDHPRAPRRAVAWAGAAIAASTLACSERIAEEDALAYSDREARESPRSAIAVEETPSVHRAVEIGSTVQVERAVHTTVVGRIERVTNGGFETTPPLPEFDLTTSVSAQVGTSDETIYTLGGIGEGLSIDETHPTPFEVELD